MKVGDKVTYVTPWVAENGIVKEVVNEQYAFVVYNCGGDWENYQQYTAARTEINSLILGWREKR